MERYDPNIDQWSMLGDMQTAREGAGLVVASGVIYCLGVWGLGRGGGGMTKGSGLGAGSLSLELVHRLPPPKTLVCPSIVSTHWDSPFRESRRQVALRFLSGALEESWDEEPQSGHLRKAGQERESAPTILSGMVPALSFRRI